MYILDQLKIRYRKFNVKFSPFFALNNYFFSVKVKVNNTLNIAGAATSNNYGWA